MVANVDGPLESADAAPVDHAMSNDHSAHDEPLDRRRGTRRVESADARTRNANGASVVDLELPIAVEHSEFTQEPLTLRACVWRGREVLRFGRLADR